MKMKWKGLLYTDPLNFIVSNRLPHSYLKRYSKIKLLQPSVLCVIQYDTLQVVNGALYQGTLSIHQGGSWLQSQCEGNLMKVCK